MNSFAGFLYPPPGGGPPPGPPITLADVNLSNVPAQTGFDIESGGPLVVSTTLTIPSGWERIVGMQEVIIKLVSGTTPDGLLPGDTVSSLTNWTGNVADVSIFGNASNNPDGTCNAVFSYSFVGNIREALATPGTNALNYGSWAKVNKVCGTFVCQGIFQPNS